MEKVNYPLLYYQIQKDAFLGILVGTDYQQIDKDVKTLKSSFSNYLQKQYKRYDEYPFIDLIDAKLKVMHVDIRPTYKDSTGSYPMSKSIRIPVPLVYGLTEQGFYECFLPLFDESFYFYEKKQFESLSKHFATNILNGKSPEELYRYLNYAEPGLETVSIKVHESREFEWSWDTERNFETLERLAERYPYSKALQKNMNSRLEAAWELEDKVADVMEKVIAQKANVLVVGNHGVGKSAVLGQAIRKIHTQSRKNNLSYTFWRLMSQRITASSKYLGEWQESVEWLIEDLNASNGVLWVVDVIRLIQSGGSGPEDSVAAFMLPYLQQGRVQLIGEVTEPELESMRRFLPGFVESFQLVKIDELPEKSIFKVLQKFADYSKQSLKIEIPEESITLVYRLLQRYFPYENFPGKGIKFLSQCVNDAQLKKTNEITPSAVITNFIKQTGLPELFLRDDLILDQDDLKQFFNSKIIGQPNAIEKLCGVVKIFKAGLNNPYKPITTLLFAGPTGVGKTASAKALSDYFFGKGQKHSPLIRIDMSEFQHPGQINRFIGNGREAGQLVKEIRERPFSVLLLDEVEKADPGIFDALMNAFDEGVMLDAFGRVTNFRNTIIIMTSNLGASNRKSIGFSNSQNEDSNYLSAISKHFRPEFINRIDGIVMFNSLNNEDVRKIALKELEELKQREGFLKNNIEVSFTEKVVEFISKIGFDERYGARPLQRAVEDHLVKSISEWLLKNDHKKSIKLKIDWKDEFIFSKL